MSPRPNIKQVTRSSCLCWYILVYSACTFACICPWSHMHVHVTVYAHVHVTCMYLYMFMYMYRYTSIIISSPSNLLTKGRVLKGSKSSMCSPVPINVMGLLVAATLKIR